MANYKSIIDVESVAQATEEMNVLVEDGGSLKKVPAGGMIGGSGGAKMLVISYKEEAAAPVSLESMPSGVYSANMTYEEFCDLTFNGELAGVTLYIVENGEISYFTLEGISTYYSPDIYLYFRHYNMGSKTLIFHNDNTITEYSNPPV